MFPPNGGFPLLLDCRCPPRQVESGTSQSKSNLSNSGYRSRKVEEGAAEEVVRRERCLPNLHRPPERRHPTTRVGRNTVTSGGPVTVTGNGADALLPPVTRSCEGLLALCLASGGSQQPVTAQEGGKSGSRRVAIHRWSWARLRTKSDPGCGLPENARSRFEYEPRQFQKRGSCKRHLVEFRIDYGAVL